MLVAFFKFIKLVRLYMWINKMEHLLKKAERHGQSFKTSYFNDLELFSCALRIDNKIYKSQKIIKRMRDVGKNIVK